MDGDINNEIQNLSEVLIENNSAGNRNIINLADPINNQDAATKAYVDLLQQQLDLLNEINLDAGFYGVLTDIEGNIYKTIKIGDQVWMAENLKTTKYNDGTNIATIISSLWDNINDPFYCWFNINYVNKEPYGAFYNFYAACEPNICPSGWHVPSKSEFATLTNYLISNGYNYDGTTSDNKIAKSMADPTDWDTFIFPGSIGNTDYPDVQNSSKFSAYPAGIRSGNTTNFVFQGEYAMFWTTDASVTYPTDAYLFQLSNNNPWSSDVTGDQNHGASIRCVRD